MFSMAEDLGNQISILLSGEARPPTPGTEFVVLKNYCEVSPNLALDDQLSEILNWRRNFMGMPIVIHDVGSD